jgi:acetyltransferase-like isoleucine patch superfamily enzyme
MFGVGTYLKSYIRRLRNSQDGTRLKAIDIGKNFQYETPIRLGKNTMVAANVKIGRYSYISSGYIYSNTTIGRYCSIAVNVIIGADEHPVDWLSTSPIQYKNDEFFSFNTTQQYTLKSNDLTTIIGNDVWIGANACIKRGVTIGDGSIIGAGAVVTKNVPPYAIMGGIPAKVIRYRFNEEIIEKLLELKWWNKEKHELIDLPFNDVNASIEKFLKKC